MDLLMDRLLMDREDLLSEKDPGDLCEMVRADLLLMDLEGHLHVLEVRLVVLRLHPRIKHHSEGTLSLIPLLARHRLHKQTFLHRILQLEKWFPLRFSQ